MPAGDVEWVVTIGENLEAERGKSEAPTLWGSKGGRVSEYELEPPSTPWKDLRGSVSLDYDATFQGERWQDVDGCVTWAFQVGFPEGQRM
jgi:hypothetical protein